MTLHTIAELVEDVRLGQPIILMDDEDRENEGDLIVAAELITPDMINFMITHARGLVCLSLSGALCDRLQLHPMTQNNRAAYRTGFTVSIEAASGVSTGISAADRAHTILTAVHPEAKAEDLVHPGHIFPIRAQDGGVLSRAGHTEASCDLAQLAGLRSASVIIEILNPDGTMARRPQLEAFAAQHGFKIGCIADLIAYRQSTP